ncbi:hypothetical protein QR680_001730 [Steinernema hermaphroditum]|uniref:Rab3 GTPase-activating protein catalytic subunit n=1 Tax=Steinernema hermaphroditum TaxID=289476 RepID=A0AA39GZL2_9BILA|nr:hypothetical protein QR680_001730 [Steinernema hermaphroditum]
MDGNSETPKADDDIFEICDFTVVTDFEHLILSLETSLIEWKLNGSSISCPSDDYFKRLPKDFLRTCTWKVDMQIMKHLDRRFKMLYYKSTPEDEEANDVGESEEASHHTKSALGLSSPLTDFVPSIISTQFGVFDFIVISDADSDFPLPEDEVLMFISAVNIATVNIDCELPIFIQIGPANNFLFSGVSQNRHVRTSFEGAYLRRPLYNHDNLSGLMGVLREKVGTPVSFPPRMTASIQFDYCFKEKLEGNFLSDFPNALIDVKSLICSQNSMFPFGTTADPLSEFRLIVRWPNQIENVVNENQTFTDLEPDYAPFWFASVDLVSSVPCLLYEGLKTVVSHISSEAGSVQTLHFTKSAESESSQTGANALSKVTNEHYSTYNFVPSTPLMKSESDEKELVSKWIEMIFSTEDHETSVAHIDKLHSRSCDVTRSQSPGTAVKQTHNEGPPFDYRHDNSEKSFDPDITKLLCTSKSAPVGSLTERICQCLARALMMEDNGLFLFSHLWMAIVGKLRSLWDNSYNLPGFSEGQAPDLSASLFHQKLQMLQCCIEAKRRSYEMYDDTTDFNSSDVFFDALEDVNEGNVTVPTSGKAEPVGRHCIAEGLFYLTDPNKQLFVPITQDRSPMTEDMLEEHAEYLSSLTDADARANAQIGSLMSDMQAFKAANPDCCMADFVRWHSPRDWIEESGGEGKLSERMSTEGNTWQTTWNAAHSVPVSLQQRLFNYSGDAEKVNTLF